MDRVEESRLVVHSAVEASLYLLVAPCPNCGHGPVRADPAEAEAQPAGAPQDFRLGGTCSNCRARWNARFRLAGGAPPLAPSPADADVPINAGSAPSSVIDVARWMTLCRMLEADAAASSDRVRARRLRVLAGRCVDEALKFFSDPDSDLPPASAFFHAGAGDVLHDRPRELTREHLLAMRARFPSPLGAR